MSQWSCLIRSVNALNSYPSALRQSSRRSIAMLFPSYFKTLVGKEVTVELKNDLAISGVLHSVDQFLNVKLTNTKVVNEAKYPHMVCGMWVS